MPRALILGIASQDGSYLAELLLAKGYEVVGTTRNAPGDNLESIPFLKSKIIHETADLLDFESVSGLVKKYQPREFYNLAALSVPSESWHQAYLVGQVTGLGPVQGLEAVRQFSPGTRFFQATSREVFGNPDSLVADESTLIVPENPYAAAKAYAHFMTGIYRRTNGLFACSGILFNHESPRRPVNFVVRKITAAVACIKNKVKSEVLDSAGRLVLLDLDSQKDRGFAGDYVEAMWLMLQSEKPKDYVIASNSLHSVQEICEIAFSRAGLNWQDYVIVDPGSKPAPSASAVKGDYSLIKKELGWQPKTDFREMIGMMVDADLSLFK
jgi:GDPmannose 4,6-dehydratase